MSIIVNGVELTEVIYAGVNLDIVKVKKGAAEAVTVFEKITQLATPQNVSANGTTVSWDAVENATSYDVLADGASIGTVENQSGETWVLNESLGMTALQKQQVNFTSNNSSFVAIEANTMSVGPQSVSYYTDDTNDIIVCESGTWINTAYRTITFETAPTGALLRWLQANATKQ